MFDIVKTTNSIRISYSYCFVNFGIQEGYLHSIRIKLINNVKKFENDK